MRTIKYYIPQIIKDSLRPIWRQVRPFTHKIILTSLMPEGCIFEVTNPVEKSRVVNLGYEEELIRIFLSEINSGDVVFDIGSCVGLYALHAALCGARVVAFEPDPIYRKRLNKNIRINKLKKSIYVVKWAVSDRKGIGTLYTDGLSTNRSPSLNQVGERGAVTVKTDTIDNAIQKGKLPLPNIVKLDIEGAEILALHGMKQLLRSKDAPQYIFIEFHPDFLRGFNSSVEECLQLIPSAYDKISSKPRDGQMHYIFKKNTS
ncbi:FkbM family methyltransferase [Thermodesulfobacteriota bacterium]